MTHEQARELVQRWRDAGPELEKFRREELRKLTDDDVRAQIHALLEIGTLVPCVRRSSGLVEQQRIFQKARR
jgi:hypothetical protein